MGLDITAYAHLTPAPHAELDSDGSPVDWLQHWHLTQTHIDGTEKNFPGRTIGIAPPGVYSFSNVLRFRAGSYSGYNAWRNALARVAGYGSADAVWKAPDEFAGRPFVELIEFSDCEGVIGPIVAAKLAKDFADNAIKAQGSEAFDVFDLQLYALWRRAFEMASDGGAVDFH